MLIYIVRRLLSAFSVVMIVLFVTFVLFYLAPTDPVAASCGAKCTPDRAADIERSLGLDQPLPERIGLYFKGLFVGRTYQTGGLKTECSAPCLGYSYQLHQPVTKMITEAVPVTFSIVLGAAVIYFSLGMVTGVMAARRRGTFGDRLLVGASLSIGSIPYFVVALLSALYLAGPVLPVAKYVPLMENPIKWAAGLTAAWFTLGVVNASSYIRYSRNYMIESLGEDYVRTARAKGISERKVVYRHALRAAIPPVITIFGLDVAFALGGAVFTETIFFLPGLGLQTLRAFGNYDFPVLQATVLIGAVVLVIMNLLVDLLYTVLDPRVRLT